MRSIPARPSTGACPLEMRADLAAYFLDYDTTGQFIGAIRRGEAPRATASRTSKGKKIPVWFRDALEEFVAERHGFSSDDISFERLHGVEFAQ
jgi:hypothetical protein